MKITTRHLYNTIMVILAVAFIGSTYDVIVSWNLLNIGLKLSKLSSPALDLMFIAIFYAAKKFTPEMTFINTDPQEEKEEDLDTGLNDILKKLNEDESSTIH